MRAQYVFAATFVVAAGLSCLVGYTPVWLMGLMVLMSLASYVFYAIDKAAATRGDRRIPEKTLHLLDVLGGWPGALVAQTRLRHKTKKVSFRVVFWLTVLVNLVVFIWLHTPDGKHQLRQLTLHSQSHALAEVS